MEPDSIKRMYAPFYENAKMCAEEVVKRLKDHEAQKDLLAKLRDAVKEVNAFENDTRIETSALNAIEHDFNVLFQKEEALPSEDISELMKAKLSKAKSRKSYSEAVTDFDAHIQKAKDNLELEDMIVEAQDNQIDPYTKKQIVHPVRSKFCNHAFEKEAVMKIIAQEKKLKGKHAQIRCPYMGCNQRFTALDLIDASGAREEDDSN